MISWKRTYHIFVVNVKYGIKTVFRTVNGDGQEITGVSEKLPFEEIIGAVVEYRGGMMIE